MTCKIIWSTPQLESNLLYIARVSSPHQDSTDTKLIKYLIDHKHWSPFDMVNICIEINTTRDISRQILRHQSMKFQEFSQRYAEVTTEPVFSEVRMQDKKNRQNSLETDNIKHFWKWNDLQEWVSSVAYQAYDDALSSGIAKELARKLLPEGMTESKMYVNGTLRSWIHYLEARLDPSTQKEHRLIAQQIKTLVASVAPLTMGVCFD